MHTSQAHTLPQQAPSLPSRLSTACADLETLQLPQRSGVDVALAEDRIQLLAFTQPPVTPFQGH